MKHFEGVKESFTAEGYQSACPNSLATTSLAMSRPALEGTQGLLPGVSLPRG